MLSIYLVFIINYFHITDEETALLPLTPISCLQVPIDSTLRLSLLLLVFFHSHWPSLCFHTQTNVTAWSPDMHPSDGHHFYPSCHTHTCHFIHFPTRVLCPNPIAYFSRIPAVYAHLPCHGFSSLPDASRPDFSSAGLSLFLWLFADAHCLTQLNSFI